MHTVTTRIYDTDSEGRKVLLYRPGDILTAQEAKRIATLADETPATRPLDDMTVKELRAVCAAEGIDPAGANLRADYIKVIGAARGQRLTNER